jgi:hypothetical protein
LQDPPKFTQIGIFGLKVYHLATQYQSTEFWWAHCGLVGGPVAAAIKVKFFFRFKGCDGKKQSINQSINFLFCQSVFLAKSSVAG